MINMASLWSALIALVLISDGGGAATVTPANSECEYFVYNFPDWPLLATFVPSVDGTCLEAYNDFSNSNFLDGEVPSWCMAQCQSLFDLYSRCIGEYYADIIMSAYCGYYNNVPCYNYQNYTYLYNVYSLCDSSTSCSASCRNATEALERYSGCCTSDSLNGPKVLCGEQPVAPCSTMVNGDHGIRFSYLALIFAAATVIL